MSETICGQEVRHAEHEDYHYIPGVLWTSAPDDTLNVLDGLGPTISGVDACGYARIDFTDDSDSRPLEAILEASLSNDHALHGKIWPEYVGALLNHIDYNPDTAPEPAERPEPTIGDAGLDKTIASIDLGYFDDKIWGPGRPNLPVNDLPRPSPGSELPRVVGHGESVAWVIKKYAPGATVRGLSLVPLTPSDPKATLNAQPFPSFSATTLTKAIEIVSGWRGIDRLVISAGIHQKEGIAHEQLKGALDRAKPTWIVAAAGNAKTTNPIWPAEHPNVLGVEARSKDAAGTWDVASYSSSNRGNVGGPGTHDVPFLSETYAVNTVFAGGASVSGTSFAAPAVAGLIAAEGGSNPSIPEISEFLRRRSDDGFAPF